MAFMLSMFFRIYLLKRFGAEGTNFDFTAQLIFDFV